MQTYNLHLEEVQILVQVRIFLLNSNLIQHVHTHLPEEAIILGHEVLWPDVVKIPIKTLTLEPLPELQTGPDTLPIPHPVSSCNNTS